MPHIAYEGGAMDLRVCKKCFVEKPLDAFPKQSGMTQGRRPVCKTCWRVQRRPYHAAYNSTHKVRLKTRKAELYQQDPAKVIARSAAWAAAHPTQRKTIANAYARRRYAANPQLMQKKVATFRAEHPEYGRAYSTAYRKTHREQVNANNSLRHARKKGAPIHEKVNIAALYERDKGQCQICHMPCIRAHASIDHVIPLAEGGEHSYRNCVLAHRSCNSRKGTRHIPQQQRLF